MTVSGIDWFRAGETLNACYNAVDRHVIRGLADHLALVGDREYSYARLLTEVGAFAGAMRGVGVSTGDEVLVGGLPPVQHVVVTLACARLGAVVFDAEPPAPVLAVLGTFPVDATGDLPVITADVTGDLTWEMAMTAGRSDPAGCSDVRAEAPLRVLGGRPVPTAEHLLAVADGEVHDDVFGPLLAGGTIHLPGW
ncbi:AMP-binding protein [Nocardioides sp. LHG3406-4]|uniref:AMP-binding protein n=1 Tax=Nocardioides sp. LHG3406-4 TaxID=2804575 RepID=UPI003CE702EC